MRDVTICMTFTVFNFLSNFSLTLKGLGSLANRRRPGFVLQAILLQIYKRIEENRL